MRAAMTQTARARRPAAHRRLLRRLASLAACGACAAAGTMARAATGTEPEIATYAIDVTAKVYSDRKHRGISETFGGPGADLTFDVAHESGLVGQLQIGTVSRVTFPEGRGLSPMLALGWRGGDPDGPRYGIGAAREWFPGAVVRGAPTGFDAALEPTGTSDTRFHTSYLLGELGWGPITLRYLHVVSRDYRGTNTATVCGTALAAVPADGDPAAALDCYGSGPRHSRGTRLFDVDVVHRLDGSTRVFARLGLQDVRHFRGADAVDYRIGVEHSRWGLLFGAEVAGARVRDPALFVAQGDGRIRRLNEARPILTVGKRF